MSGSILMAFLLGACLGAGAVLCFFEWLDTTRENKWNARFPLLDYTNDPECDPALKPLDAHHPDVQRDAMRRAEAARKAKQRIVQQTVDRNVPGWDDIRVGRGDILEWPRDGGKPYVGGEYCPVCGIHGICQKHSAQTGQRYATDEEIKRGKAC